MASVKFRIRGKGNNRVSIYLYLSISRGKLLEANSGFSILPKNWSKTLGKPKQNSENNRLVHGDLLTLEGFIYEEVNQANGKGELIDIHWLRSKIKECFNRSGPSDDSLLISHIQCIIDSANTRKIKGTNKIGLSERRVTGYKTFKGLMERFEVEIKKRIHLEDISKNFVDRFTNWMINKEAYSINYAGKALDNLKTVCLDAEKIGLKIHPFAKQIEGFKERNEDRYIVTLSFEELEQIRKTELETKALRNARKWMLIGCEIGQRASDLLKISPDNIRYEKGRIYIDIEQQKTGKYVTVGIIAPHIIEIIENDFPYRISTQKLNKKIKTVCKLAEIEEIIEGKKFDKKKKRKVFGKYPKWELITSHSFRRSFSTNYYKKIPTAVLIGITGHSKESMFLEYINRREDKDQNADLFMQFYENMQKEFEPKMRIVK